MRIDCDFCWLLLGPRRRADNPLLSPRSFPSLIWSDTPLHLHHGTLINVVLLVPPGQVLC